MTRTRRHRLEIKTRHAVNMTNLSALQKLHPQHLRPPQLSCSSDVAGNTYVWFVPSAKPGHEGVLQHLAMAINNTLAQALGTPAPAAATLPSAPTAPAPGSTGQLGTAATGAMAGQARPNVYASHAATPGANQASGPSAPSHPAAIDVSHAQQQATRTDEDVARRMQTAELHGAGMLLQDLGSAMQQARVRPGDSELPSKAGEQMPSLGSTPGPMCAPNSSAVCYLQRLWCKFVNMRTYLVGPMRQDIWHACGNCCATPFLGHIGCCRALLMFSLSLCTMMFESCVRLE
jgi:hypothetical protein